MGTRTLVAAVLAAALVLPACAGIGGADRPGGGPDAPVGSTPDPTAPVPEPTPLVVRPRDGLVDVHPRPWEDAQVLDERTLLVTFWDGVEECYGLSRVEVDSSDAAVTVTLFTGRVPTAEVCIEIALLKSVRVRLGEPLDGRPIHDGAATE